MTHSLRKLLDEFEVGVRPHHHVYSGGGAIDEIVDKSLYLTPGAFGHKDYVIRL